MTKVKTILGKTGFDLSGEWKQGTYNRFALVSFAGCSFVSIVDENTALLTDATKWMVIARKGDKGDAFIYDDFTPDQLAKLKGDKGDPFIYDDFTTEQIVDLKKPAIDAAKIAEDAVKEVLNTPKIDSGTWWVYDLKQKQYVDSESPATGKSPKIVDSVWWEWKDETGEYVSTNISANSDYELTKGKVENVLIGDITTHNHAVQLAEALASYVQTVAGKQLSSEDFTTLLKNKLEGLSNYNDAAVIASIVAVGQRIDALVGASASEAIDTFKEIEAFLQGITDTKTLTGLMADLKTEIKALIPTKLSQLSNDNNTIKDANYVHTDNNYTTAEKNKLSGIATNANNYTHPSDANTRHVTDTEKQNWNSKASENHNHNTVYQAKETGKGLTTNDFTNDYKNRIDKAVVPSDLVIVTTLVGLPINKYNIKFTYTNATALPISFATIPVDGFECIISILNSAASDITQAIPNAVPWQSEDANIGLPVGKVTEISIRYVHGKYIVRV